MNSGGDLHSVYKKALASPTKVGKVMGEFKAGTLKTSAGTKVKDAAQAKAIGLSEARRGK